MMTKPKDSAEKAIRDILRTTRRQLIADPEHPLLDFEARSSFAHLQAASIQYRIAIGAFWTYIAPIGAEFGYSSQQTGTAISIGLMSAFAGSWAASTALPPSAKIIAAACDARGCLLATTRPSEIIIERA
jgi:hypothetical protein